MAGPNVDVGTGSTLVFSTTSYTTEITNMSFAGQERKSIETTHLGSIGGNTYMRGDLVEPGTLEVTCHFQPDNPPPIYTTVSQENVVVTYPAFGTQATGAKQTVAAFIMSLDGPAIAVDEKMEQTMTLKLSGVISQTDGV
jgi:hypothetical protein